MSLFFFFLLKNWFQMVPFALNTMLNEEFILKDRGLTSNVLRALTVIDSFIFFESGREQKNSFLLLLLFIVVEDLKNKK